MRFVIVCIPPQSFLIVKVTFFSQKIRCSMRRQSTLMFVTTFFMRPLLVVTLLLLRLVLKIILLYNDQYTSSYQV